MIDRLLEIRELLFEAATALYGDLFITEDAFWGSVTDRQLQENTIQLATLGHQFDGISEEQLEAAKELAKKLGLDLDL